jgi:hypothetical protein
MELGDDGAAPRELEGFYAVWVVDVRWILGKDEIVYRATTKAAAITGSSAVGFALRSG